MEKIVIPHKLTRRFIASNKQWIFLFSYDAAQKGILGQAWFAFGEPNAYPIFTCRKLCPSSLNRYYQDLDEYKEVVEQCIKNIPSDERPIIPFPKIGEGCSRLKEFSPNLYEYLHKRINEIKYPNIVIDYRMEIL